MSGFDNRFYAKKVEDKVIGNVSNYISKDHSSMKKEL